MITLVTNKFSLPSAIPKACFHGENWCACPYCEKSFEVWDCEYERDGFEKARVYRNKDQEEIIGNHFKCGQCGKVFRLS